MSQSAYAFVNEVEIENGLGFSGIESVRMNHGFRNIHTAGKSFQHCDRYSVLFGSFIIETFFI